MISHSLLLNLGAQIRNFKCSKHYRGGMNSINNGDVIRGGISGVG